MEIVNGYVCRNCEDVALAKKNIDPADPKNAEREEEEKRRRVEAAQNAGRLDQDAVALGGALADVELFQAVSPVGETNRADAYEHRPGANFDLTA